MRTYRALAECLRRELGGAVATEPGTDQVAAGGERRRTRVAGAGVSLPGSYALVGRVRELAETERIWESVSTGAAAVAVVRGEPGIGKTRLVSELRARAGASGALCATEATLDLGCSCRRALPEAARRALR